MNLTATSKNVNQGTSMGRVRWSYRRFDRCIHESRLERISPKSRPPKAFVWTINLISSHLKDQNSRPPLSRPCQQYYTCVYCLAFKLDRLSKDITLGYTGFFPTTNQKKSIQEKTYCVSDLFPFHMGSKRKKN